MSEPKQSPRVPRPLASPAGEVSASGVGPVAHHLDASGAASSPPSSVQQTILGLDPVATRSLAEGEPRPSASASAPPPPRVDPYVGKTIDGRYRVESLLGEGGMGVVYLARHKVIGKRVAVKVLRSDFAQDGEITERFLQEARAASSIGNAHIVDISDFGDLPDGSTYFVMEWLDGVPLSHVLRDDSPLPVARLARLALQIADGLAAAHRAGIVHRDLKPDNVFVVQRDDEDFVKILDFGIAKVGTASIKLTRAGSVFGTPHYMSPEQAAGAPVDARTDVYALGVILYEMASGSVPFDADNFMGVLTQHVYKAPLPFRALEPPPAVPPELEAIVLKALAKLPDERYASMEALGEDLQALLDGGLPVAAAERLARSDAFQAPAQFFPEHVRGAQLAPEPASARARRPTALVAGLAGVAVAGALVAALFARGSSGGATSSPSGVVAVGGATSAVPPAASALAAAAPVIAPRATRRVLLETEPSDARVLVDGADRGSPPLALDVPEGAPFTVEVRRDGYLSETLAIDGAQPTAKVTLRRADAPAKAPPRAGARPVARPTKPAPGRVDGIIDPWASPH